MSRARSSALLLAGAVALATMAGCGDDVRPADYDAGTRDAGDGDAAGMDAGPAVDAGDVDAAGMDAGPAVDAGDVDAGAGVDAGDVDAGPSMPAPPAEVTHTGTGGYLLRGTVLTPTGAIAGEVLVVGNAITCVAADCSGMPMAGTVTAIDTHATISPGLVNAHDHITYDFLPEWVPPRMYTNRYDWADDPTYNAFVQPEADGGSSGAFVCPSSKWAELRSLVHGTTTIQGESPEQSCVSRLARNADHFHGLGPDHMQTTVASVRTITDTARTTIVSNFLDGSTTRYAVHMEEGYSGRSVDLEFASYAGRDTRTVSLLAPMTGMPYGTGLFIHALGLTAAELTEAAGANAKFVWSPSSNIILYGRTADIATLLSLGAVIGIGPDWTLSGSDEMLSEMRYAEAYGETSGIAAITPRRIWEMSTSGGAEAVGLSAFIGRLEVGQRADITVFGRTGADPYRAVLDSRAADVRLVLMDGAGYYGDAALETVAAVNTSCEALDACGTPKFLCAANTPGAASRATETVADIRGQLTAYLATYGRAAELLDLVDCSL